MEAELPGVRRAEHVMGMQIVVDVRDPDVDNGLLDSVFDWLRHVDATFSTYKDDSAITRLNRRELELEEVESDVRWILERCEELRVETGGFFDMRAGASRDLDPSGLVKGWSVDRAASILDHAGVSNYAISAGGDIRLCGRPVPEEAWRVGIQHPQLRHTVAAVVEGRDLAVATSGAYARGNHILDPHTHRPPSGVLSVTVVGPDLATADAYATAAFAMGRDGAPWTALLRGYEAMTVLTDGTVLSTAAFPLARAAAIV